VKVVWSPLAELRALETVDAIAADRIVYRVDATQGFVLTVRHGRR
jgi:hypothetical protein